MQLDYIAAGLLYLLWRHRRNGNGAYLSAHQLRDELIGGEAGFPIKPEALKAARAKITLARLQKEGFCVRSLLSKTETEKPGPAPNGFQFSVNAPIIKERVTAAVVMFLKHHAEQRVTREKLIQELSATGWGHTNSSRPLNSVEYEEQVAYCLRKGYFVEEDVIDDVSETTQKQLSTTRKVEEFGLFLAKLAAEVSSPKPLDKP